MLFYLLYRNIINKLNKSKNHPSTFVYYLLFVKWNIVFTLRSIYSGPAKTWPIGPFATALSAGMLCMPVCFAHYECKYAS